MSKEQNNRENWAKQFEKDNGRKPSLEEFKKAKENNFSIDSSEDKILNKDNSDNNISLNENNSNRENWAKQFEKDNGRKPSLEEFKKAKENNFSIDSSEDNSANSTVGSSEINVDSNIQKNIDKPKNKKKKTLFFSLAAILMILLLILGYNFYYSKVQVTKRYSKILNSHDSAKYSKIVVWKGEDKEIDKKELEPLVNYFKTIDESDIEEDLSGNKLGKGIDFEKDGSLFSRYKIVLDPQDIKIKTNYGDLKVDLFKEKIGEVSKGKILTLKHKTPGLYKFSASGEDNSNKFDLSKEVYIPNKDDLVELNVKKISFSVSSNIKDGFVYLEDKIVGKIENSKSDIKDLQVIKGQKLFVKGTDDGEKVRSEKIDISSVKEGEDVILNSTTATKNSDNKKSTEKLSNLEAETLISDAYSSINGSSYVDLDDVFVNGSKNKFYKDVSEMRSNNLDEKKSVRAAESVDFDDLNIVDVKDLGDNEFDVEFNIVYDFYYDSDTDKDDKKTSGHLYQDVSDVVRVIYDKSKHKFLIKTPDDFKITHTDDQVN